MASASLSERLAAVGELLIALAGSPVPSHQFQILADYTPHVLPCDYVALCLVAADGDGYYVHTLYADDPDLVPRRLFDYEEGCLGQVLQTGRLHNITDLAQVTPACPDLEGAWCNAGLCAALAAPVRQGEQQLGALMVASQTPGRYASDDIQVLRLLVAGLAATLETSRLYQILADERSTLAAVLRSTQDAILVANQNGVVLLANPAVRDMLGLEPDQMVGRPLQESLAHEMLRDLFAEGQRVVADIPLVDGRTAQASLVPVVTDYGQRIGWAAILRDITLLKELEQVKNDFVNTVSHDLKNPIATIRLGTGLLDRAGPLNEQQRQLQGRLINTVEYMEELVTDLLDLGKIEMGLEMHPQSFDVAALADEVLEAYRPEAEQKAIKMMVDVESELCLVADPARLKQALRNLLGNAIKYTPAGGHVLLTAYGMEVGRREEPMVEARRLVTVKVVDTGLGIPAEALPHVFDKFYRVQSSATRQIRGTGLGLAITKSIIEAHQGRIWVESEEGVGSTFSFTLPQ